MDRRPHLRFPLTEHAWYVALTALLGAAYLAVAFLLPTLGPRGLALQEDWFGFSQLRWLGAPLTLAILALILVRFRRARADADRPAATRGPAAWVPPALAVAAVAVFFLLRNEFVNSDGQMFGGSFQHALRTGGTPVTHDEMLEFYVHDRAWLVAHAWWGWSVKLTYQVASALAGGVFVLLLLEYCRLVRPSGAWLLFALCLSGGYVQLFFGDVENYTLTATLLMAYFLASTLFLRGRAPLWQPSLLLALAMAFHLVAGFLAPSLAWLAVVAWRGGRKADVVRAAALFAGVLAATLLFFQWNGLPIADLYLHSHALGEGGHFAENLVVPSLAYYHGLFNLLLLLAPALLLLVPLLLHRRIALDPENVHLAIAAGFLLVFVCTWRAQLGVYEDWNLFAAVALPVSLLVWRNVANAPLRLRRPAVLFGVLGAIHSLAWIAANHLIVR